MFSLDIPNEPYWLDLPLGVRVKVRPLSGLVIAAARRLVQRDAIAILTERRERMDAGVPADDLLDLDDECLRDAFERVEMARGLGRYGIMAWEGVGNADGTDAVPLTPDNAEAMATHPDMMDAFLTAYFKPVEALAAEGNASAPMPNGTTAPGANTAADAQPRASIAQDQPAHH